MPILGITGGIASGKSSFRRLLLERVQADSFDADACARDLLEKDDAVKSLVREQIHPRAYEADGTVNRDLLRELIYQDATKKSSLEAILHPRVRERWSRQAEKVRTVNRLFVVDIPLLFETKAESLFDRIVTVACSQVVQLERLRSQRGLTDAISLKIIATQAPMSLKISGSHHVIWNDGSLEALIAQTDCFARILKTSSLG